MKMIKVIIDNDIGKYRSVNLSYVMSSGIYYKDRLIYIDDYELFKRYFSVFDKYLIDNNILFSRFIVNRCVFCVKGYGFRGKRIKFFKMFKNNKIRDFLKEDLV